MKDYHERLETKLDKVSDEIGNINITLAKQHITLEEHVRRTEILEDEIRPIKKHVAMVNGVLKLMGLLAPIIGAIAGALRWFNA